MSDGSRLSNGDRLGCMATVTFAVFLSLLCLKLVMFPWSLLVITLVVPPGVVLMGTWLVGDGPLTDDEESST